MYQSYPNTLLMRNSRGVSSDVLTNSARYALGGAVLVNCNCVITEMTSPIELDDVSPEFQRVPAYVLMRMSWLYQFISYKNTLSRRGSCHFTYGSPLI